MIKFIIGVIIGIAAATVGFSGLVSMADKGVKETQRVVKDVAKSDAASEAKKVVSKAVDEVSK